VEFSLGARELPSPATSFLYLVGPGIDATVTEANLRLLGPGVRIVPGSVRLVPGYTVSGRPVVEAAIEVAGRGFAADASLFVVKGSEIAPYTGAITLLGQPPSFPAVGVVNAASFASGAVSPGEIVSIFGTVIGPTQGVENAGFDPNTGRMRTELAGVTVLFDGVPAPLFFVRTDQINLQVPYEVAGKANTTVTVRYGEVSSTGVIVPVAPARPGIFQHNNRALIFNPDGSINSPTNWAPRNQYVTLYGTGSGIGTPAVATGVAAPGDPNLSLARNPQARIGGQPATVSFAGMAPGFVGLTQINLLVPAGAPTGDAVPLEIWIDGAPAQAGMTIAIQ
jgi:uncharacterized protein (TIGR03437 family)